ncbi:PAS domain S-box-containing protein [Pseudoduganella namucuonensis]|uniref:histidine kinase n=1 Tax=Pseudoduganella namucuonensis TaxID=1035707 RepID=A0A1I7JE06_9BURK|nr:PAS domain S-box-containing protein [Pseudoduganella namucuonensis]
MLDEVASFIDDGLRCGGTGIVIATAEHRAELERRLAGFGAPKGTSRHTGRLECLDADETLSQFMIEGWPDATRFEQTVGRLVRAAAASGGAVHAFGEMVAVLCAQGRYEAALRLEELWNDLAKEARFALFCAYPWKLFRTAEHSAAFGKVCSAHDHAGPCHAHAAEPAADPARRILELEQQAIALQSEIARRRAAELALAERERELAEFLDNAAEGIHRVDADGTILWANNAELKLLGYRWEHYIGRPITDFHADRAVIDDILARLKMGETLNDVPARLRRQDGGIRHVLISTNGCFEDGELRYTRCFTRDASERYQRDEALTQRDRMLTHAPVGAALVLGPEFAFYLANQRFCDMTHRGPLEGSTFQHAFPELAGTELDAQLRRVLETGEPYAAEEARLPIDNGEGLEERFFQVGLQPLTGADGQVQGVILVLVDVGEHVRLRLSLENAQAAREAVLAELTASGRAKDEFLAMLGHELRNPLSPIVSAVELMRIKGDGRTQREQEVIRRQLSHLVRLVDDLLDISRVNSGRIELHIEHIALDDMLGKAAEMVRPLLGQRCHQFSLEVEPGISLRGDAVRLAQAFSNLLTNAARYTPPGGRVRLVARSDGPEHVRVCVEDNGVGIPADILPRIFDLFFQGKRGIDRAEGGLGVGLALVQYIVSLHGGEVAAHSAGQGGGSEFAVRLPLAGPADDA